jgi:hypothetical protein
MEVWSIGDKDQQMSMRQVLVLVEPGTQRQMMFILPFEELILGL